MNLSRGGLTLSCAPFIMHEYMQRPSALRRMVDDRLGESATQWIGKRRQQGRSVEEAWIALREVTQVPIALRTLYVWLEKEESK